LTFVEYGSSTQPVSLLDFKPDLHFMAQVAIAWLEQDSSVEYAFRKEFEKKLSRMQAYNEFKYNNKLDEYFNLPDAEMPLLTLAVFDDTRVEVMKDENGDILAEITYSSNDSVERFVVYLGDEGAIVIEPLYDRNGVQITSIITTYDSDGNVTNVQRTALTEPLPSVNSSSSTSASVTETTSISDETSDAMTMSAPMAMMSMGTPEAPQSGSEVFNYSPVGNRMTASRTSGFTTTYTYTNNDLNQYTNVEETIAGLGINSQISHDVNGNLSVNEFGLTHDYDYRNRLVDVNDLAGFDYDAFGRRIKKTASGVTTYFYYDTAGRVIAEHEGATTPALAKTFVYGNGIDEVLAMFKHPDTDATQDQLDDWNEFIGFADAWLADANDPNCTTYDSDYDDNSDDVINLEDFAAFASVWDIADSSEKRFYYLHDALGSIMGITGGKYKREEDREFYLYDVYGKPDGASPAGNPYMFTGRRYDPETGLYYYRARYMSPTLGRFISMDPYGYVDGMNMYEYVGGNPTNYVDPYGYFGVYTGGGVPSVWDDWGNESRNRLNSSVANTRSKYNDVVSAVNQLGVMAQNGNSSQAQLYSQVDKILQLSDQYRMQRNEAMSYAGGLIDGSLLGIWGKDAAAVNAAYDLVSSDALFSGLSPSKNILLEEMMICCNNCDATEGLVNRTKAVLTTAKTTETVCTVVSAAGGVTVIGKEAAKLGLKKGAVYIAKQAAAAALTQAAATYGINELKNRGVSETQIRVGMAALQALTMRKAFQGKQGCTKPKGMNNPKVKSAASKGRQAHREFAKKVKGKKWDSETSIRGPNGELLRPDAIDPKGRPVELKPNTPSGRAQGKRQIQKYKNATGTNGRVVYYDPDNY